MASIISTSEVPSASGQLYYCHQCSHQWRKTENSDFVCPRCSEGFIEEINDNNTPPSERERDPADPIYSILHRLMADSISSPGRTRAQGASRRVRSRSPRMVMMSSMSRDDQPSASTASFYRQHLVDSTVHFDLDDFMSTFLSSPRSNPVNERRLEELPKETITDELSSTQCSICFDEFKVAESCVRKLPCNHLFHQNCIFPWLRINGTCPVCRARLNIGTNEADNSTETTPQPSFDNILRLMRIRRNSLRRFRSANEPSTSSDALEENGATATPLEPARIRRAFEARRAGAGSSFAWRPMRFRAPSTGSELRTNPMDGPTLRRGMSVLPSVGGGRVTRSQTLSPMLSIPNPIIDLTSSDTESSMQTAPVPRSREGSSSSSSSSSSNSSGITSSVSSTSFITDVSNLSSNRRALYGATRTALSRLPQSDSSSSDEMD